MALLNDGTRIYSKTGAASYNSPNDTLQFESPAGCKQLWLVVTGAPSMHWRHAWDDNDSNDEQWPYQVKFSGTNRLGYQNIPNSVSSENENNIQIYTFDNKLIIDKIPLNAEIRIFNIAGACILNEKSGDTSFSTQIPSGIYIVNINGTFNRKIVVN